MIKPPQAYGLILCERVRIETNPASFCLDGLFLGREFKAFPTPWFAFDVYAALFDGRGEGEMRLTCTWLEKEEDIYYHGRWYAFSRQVQTVLYTHTVRKLRFQNAGRYAFTLSFNKVPFTVRYLDVREARR